MSSWPAHRLTKWHCPSSPASHLCRQTSQLRASFGGSGPPRGVRPQVRLWVHSGQEKHRLFQSVVSLYLSSVCHLLYFTAIMGAFLWKGSGIGFLWNMVYTRWECCVHGKCGKNRVVCFPPKFHCFSGSYLWQGHNWNGMRLQRHSLYLFIGTGLTQTWYKKGVEVPSEQTLKTIWFKVPHS